MGQRNRLDSLLAAAITQLHASLKVLLGAWTGAGQPGSAEEADLRMQQGLRAASQLQLVRDAILNLNSLACISSLLEDFMQLCYSTAGTTAKTVHLEGESANQPPA